MTFEKDNTNESMSKRWKLMRGTTVDSKALISSEKYKIQELSVIL